MIDTTHQPENWKKRFSKEFTDNILEDGCGNDLIITKEDVEPLMDFISQLLTEQLDEVEKIIGDDENECDTTNELEKFVIKNRNARRAEQRQALTKLGKNL